MSGYDAYEYFDSYDWTQDYIPRNYGYCEQCREKRELFELNGHMLCSNCLCNAVSPTNKGE